MNHKTIYTHYLPVILCLGMTFGLSSIPRLAGPDLGIPFSDKIFHFAEYCATGFFLTRLIDLYLSTIPNRNFVIILIAVASIALLDELYQGIVPGRFTDPMDFLADLIGGLAGWVIFRYFSRRRSASQKLAG